MTCALIMYILSIVCVLVQVQAHSRHGQRRSRNGRHGRSRQREPAANGVPPGSQHDREGRAGLQGSEARQRKEAGTEIGCGTNMSRLFFRVFSSVTNKLYNCRRELALQDTLYVNRRGLLCIG